MIEVEVKYYKVNIGHVTKNNPDGIEMFVVTDMIVKGHANDGTTNSVKCCAGVTAILTGFMRVVNHYLSTCTLSKGDFEYHFRGSKIEYTDLDMYYGANCVWCQLFDVYKMYPHLFKRFDMIEVERENYYAKCKKSKQ